MHRAHARFLGKNDAARNEVLAGGLPAAAERS
jgi:hypothetical protein